MEKKKIVLGVVALAVVIALMAGLYLIFGPKTTEGDKHISVQVIVEDEVIKEHEFDTSLEYLGEVLEQENIIEGEQSEYGLFIHAVDGVKADESKQEWWCITKKGEDVMTGVDQTPIQDGDCFEFTLKVGY